MIAAMIKSKPLKVIVSIIASLALILIAFVAFAYLSLSGGDQVYDRTSDWDNYYRQVVSNYFKLPPEAKIRKAEHTDTSIMGMHFEVHFMLPNMKTPEEWIDSIASASNIQVTYKRNKHLYDCSDECDLLKLEYLPKEGIYVVEAGWD